MIMHDSRLSGLGLSPGQERSLVLGQNVLLSAPLSTQVYIIGICELHATEGGGGGGVTWIDYHPIKRVWGIEMLQHFTLQNLR